MSCPSTTRCVAVDETGRALAFNPDLLPAMVLSPTVISVYAEKGVACPSVTECMGVNDGGNAITFDPTNLANKWVKNIDAVTGLVDVVCPSTTQCTAVDDKANEITVSSPASPGATYTTKLLGNGYGYGEQALACASTTVCVAGNNYDHEVTFNPVHCRGLQRPRGRVRPVPSRHRKDGDAFRCDRSPRCQLPDPEVLRGGGRRG